ncbi:MAG: pantoate--beta-alanine ligase [Nitrospirota bacterium]|nr:pantoate--beta-alanine ligase [Nitrospirota bacterium]
MRIIRSIRGFQAWRRQHENEEIGFVPTMGALHEGHLSLIRRARKHCSKIIVSIFVNPLQFGPTEDLSRYPRPVKSDQQLCREAGVDLLFRPSREEFYPEDFQTSVKVNRLSQRWEGKARPTHFEGVTTVVTKLLCLVRPHRAFFGQKDYQQLLVIKQLVRDLNLATTIVRCPTIRESDGLALSSRNRYLSESDRRQAIGVSSALYQGVRMIQAGARHVPNIQKTMKNVLAKWKGLKIEYLAVCDAANLEPLTNAKGSMVLLAAVRLGHVRLIDNMLVKI